MLVVAKNKYRLCILLFMVIGKAVAFSPSVIERLGSNIFQYRSDSYMNGWSCGFFVLNNAQTIEHMVTGKRLNSMSSCNRMLRAKNMNPRQSTCASTRVALNNTVFHLPNFNSLSISPDGSVLLTAENIEYLYSFTTRVSQCSVVSNYDEQKLFLRHTCTAPWHLRMHGDKVKEFADNQWKKQVGKYFEDMRQVINNVDRTGKPVAFHFDCTLAPAEKHCMLLSVVKKPKQKPYIIAMDNLNHSMTKNNIRKKMVQFLEKQFCATFSLHDISKKCHAPKKHHPSNVYRLQPQAIMCNIDRLSDYQLDLLIYNLRCNKKTWRFIDPVLLKNLLG